MASISPEQAHKYTRCWQQVGLREAEELREASLDLKLQQLAALETCERWRKLRLALGRWLITACRPCLPPFRRSLAGCDTVTSPAPLSAV